MSNWSTSHPEEAERIGRLRPVDQNRAEREAQAKWLQQPEPIPFDPWYEDPQRISKLLLWLAVKKEVPRGAQAIADFISNASTWGKQYAELCEVERAFDK